MQPVKAHFDGKVFVPEGPVDLPKDAAVTLWIEPSVTTPPGAVDALAWMVQHAIDDESIPEDLSTNLDRHLNTLRAQLRPYADAAGYLTDEDIFKAVS